MEQMDLLQAFEIIVDKAKNSSLGEKFYEETDSYLGFVSDKLDISKRASAIMALFADRCDDSHIQFSDFTNFLGCRILSLLRYANEIQELVDKEYICCNRDEGFYYTIPMEVMEAFQHNERYNPMDVEELTARELFDKFDELFTKCRRRKIDKQVLRRKLRALVAKNEKLAFVKAMASYDVDADNMYFPLSVLFCTLFVVNGDDDIRYHDLEFIYKEDDAEWRCAKRGLSQGNHLFLWRSSLNIPMTMALWIESRSKLRMMPRNSFSRNSTYHPCVVLARRVACSPLRTSAPSNYSTIARNKGKWKS